MQSTDPSTAAGFTRRTPWHWPALILVLALGLGVLDWRVGASGQDDLAQKVDHGTFQAVFLTNNEVYFGRLSVPSGQFCYLTHVYRLTAVAGKKGLPLSRTLVKLTSDVDSPRDVLVIARAQILYVENLNPHGQAARLLARSG